MCRWDAESRQFQTLQLLDGSRGDGATPVPSSSPPPAQIAPSPLEQAIVHRMDTLRRQAGRCALRHVPAPAATWAAEGGGGARATFAVTVQLPPGCRVVGWEAATAAAAAPGGNVGVVAAGASRAPAEAVRGGAGAAGGDGGEVEAAVLVRRQAGPYLPVRVVSLSLPLPLPRGSCPGAEDADSSSAVLVTAKVRVGHCVCVLDVASVGAPRRGQSPATGRVRAQRQQGKRAHGRTGSFCTACGALACVNAQL